MYSLNGQLRANRIIAFESEAELNEESDFAAFPGTAGQTREAGQATQRRRKEHKTARKRNTKRGIRSKESIQRRKENRTNKRRKARQEYRRKEYRNPWLENRHKIGEGSNMGRETAAGILPSGGVCGELLPAPCQHHDSARNHCRSTGNMTIWGRGGC